MCERSRRDCEIVCSFRLGFLKSNTKDEGSADARILKMFFLNYWRSLKEQNIGIIFWFCVLTFKHPYLSTACTKLILRTSTLVRSGFFFMATSLIASSLFNLTWSIFPVFLKMIFSWNKPSRPRKPRSDCKWRKSPDISSSSRISHLCNFIYSPPSDAPLCGFAFQSWTSPRFAFGNTIFILSISHEETTKLPILQWLFLYVLERYSLITLSRLYDHVREVWQYETHL